jgi:hypothetical protein
VTITILLYNYAQVPPATLAVAEREANKILATAGAQIDWVHCPPISAPDASELCRRGWTPQTPGLRLITGANKFQHAQFGYTAIPVLVTVYYEKVLLRAQRDNFPAQLPSLLGCVIAHELGHLLLQAPGHSTRGIMQSQWSVCADPPGVDGHVPVQPRRGRSHPEPGSHPGEPSPESRTTIGHP